VRGARKRRGFESVELAEKKSGFVAERSTPFAGNSPVFRFFS
jgi:hypothetical protein